MKDFERAWELRQSKGWMRVERPALRIFHGPGEALQDRGKWRSFSVDRFGDYAWITHWPDSEAQAEVPTGRLLELRDFLGRRGFLGGVWIQRWPGRPAELPQVIWGNVPQERFEVEEDALRFKIQLLETRHPGLFLDHEPLRRWLREQARDWDILNTFSYTGSLSVAAAKGGARRVVSVDLSKPSLAWAKENWEANALDPSKGAFWSEDAFETFRKGAKRGSQYDCVILDPPSFSRGGKASRKSHFSTSQDLTELHEQALRVLRDGGVLITCVNSAKLSWNEFDHALEIAFRSARKKARVLLKHELPESFPTLPGDEEERYLKGYVLRIES